MAYTTINKSTDYFNTLLWQGNGNNARSITGVGFQPDFTWIKDRDDTESHCLTDVVRGATKSLRSNGNNAEVTDADALQSFDSDGFTVGTQGQVNKANGDDFVGWNWKAGGSSTTNPSGGTITTTASVNTTAGFSVFTYTGTGNAAHIAHGLGAAPTVVIIKGRSNTDQWFVKHPGLLANQYIYLNGTGNVASGANVWSATNPDATKIYIGTDAGVNGNGETYVCYAFAEKRGYSQFGTYKGNGSTDGAFVYTGFRPRWVLIRGTGSNRNWNIIDSTRDTDNPAGDFLQANTTSAEDTSSIDIDFLSNGFKSRVTSGRVNTSDETYLYMAFGQSLVGSNNVPATAR